MDHRTLTLALLLLAPALAGCIGEGGQDLDPAQLDDATTGQPGWTATYELPETITGLAEAAEVDLEAGQGLVVRDGIAYVSGGGSGFYTANVSDPRSPALLGEVRDAPSRDVDLLDYADGRTVAVLAEGGPTMHFVDVTDPAQPELLTSLDVGANVHNLVVHPDEHLVYNSRSLGDAVEPGIDIVDASDPANPEVTKVWTFPRVAGTSPTVTTGCHDITVYPEHDRAYCPGVSQTYLLDISDPLSPTVISTITNPLINIHHWALATADHDTLIIGDEYGGAIAPACFGHQELPGMAGGHSVSSPTGAAWFYDISDPTNPMLQGWFSPPTETEAPAPCTAHFGELVEDRSLVAIGWYNAGVLLVDFSDPTFPQLVSQWDEGHNVWEARYANGHLFTGNADGGMDVLRFT